MSLLGGLPVPRKKKQGQGVPKKQRNFWLQERPWGLNNKAQELNKRIYPK